MQRGPDTQIAAIVNLTTDSFSDGGRWLDPIAALDHAQALLQAGAELVDLGAASSHPDAASVAPELERARLAELLDRLPVARVSVDSCTPSVQLWALEQGVAMLNDIHGFAEPSLYPRLADSDCQLVVMHSVQGAGASKADRRALQPEQVWTHLLEFFDQRLAALLAAGVARDRLLLDPGMGFFLGSHAEASWHVLQRLPELRARYGLRLYVSVSRKSFLAGSPPLPPQERGPATLACETMLLGQVAWLRTHDAAALAQARSVWQSLQGAQAV